MATYTCAVCEGTYNDNDVMSANCAYCKKTVCIYCTELDPVSNIDVCDKCADDGMFVETPNPGVSAKNETK